MGAAGDMKLIQKSRNARRRGTAMLYAVFAAFSAATIVAVMLTMSLASNRVSAVKAYGGRAEYLAEGAVEAAKQVILQSVANFKTPPATGQVTINGTPVTYNIAPTGFSTVVTARSGLQSVVTTFDVRSTASVLGHGHTARRMINAEATPVFQYAVFYNTDLEINPGPNMTLAGRVHSNSDMFLNCGNTLSVDTNYLYAVGGIYRHRKDDPTKSSGTVDVRNWVANPFNPSELSSFYTMHSKSQLAAQGVPSAINKSGYDSNFTAGWDANGNGSYADPGDFYPWAPGALEYWKEPAGYVGGYGNTVQSAAHNTTAALPPSVGSTQMYEPAPGGDWTFNGTEYQYTPGVGTHNQGFYHQNADLKLIGLNGAVKAYDSNNQPVSLAPGVATMTTIYDARQGGDVEVIEVDMSLLNTLSAFPANGLIYTSHYGLGSGTNAAGVKLKNASELASNLTVVSEASLYIHGDYNKTNKKSAAIIADAVNLLSNAWDGSKTSGSGLPTASGTIYNAAILTGNQETVGSAYNGGLENLPRFHENWSKKACVIQGSFVNFWNSVHASGPWKYGGNRYTAPKRFWSYDQLFNNVATLPPFTPMAVRAHDVVFW